MIILKYLIIFFLVFFGAILAFMLYSSNGKVKDTPSYACVRYHHIDAFLDKHSEIGIDELKKLFSTPLDDGGVYQTGMSVRYPVAEVTNYALIAELASGQFIYSNHTAKDVWIELDINHYLHSN